MRINRLEKAFAAIILLSLMAGLGLSQLSARPVMAASNYLHTSGSKIYDSSNRAVKLERLELVWPRDCE